jgi:NADPH2:quinone reductase
VIGTLLTLPSTPMTPTSLPPLKVGSRVMAPAPNSFAEYTTISWTKVAVIPDEVDSKDAVAACTTGLTAVGLAKESYAVKKGDWVLIRAAAGGVGAILVQVSLGHSPCSSISTVLFATPHERA